MVIIFFISLQTEYKFSYTKLKYVSWSHLLFDPRYSDIVDIFEGAFRHSRGVFRSEKNSCMKN